MRNYLGHPQFLSLTAIIVGTITVLTGSLACSDIRQSRKVDSVSFGALPTGSAALVYIAQAQSFFEANGLDVTVRDYATGVATTDALLKGDVDIAWSAELPIVRKAFSKEKISIIAVSSRFVDDQFLFGRKDRGIVNIADVKGKRIGIPINTIAEFYLGRFLELNGLSRQAVQLVDVQPHLSVEAIAAGNIDGVVTWDPFSSQINAQLGEKVVVIPVQSGQAGYGVISARNEWLRENPGITRRFLESLARAEDFLTRNPQSGNDIVQKRVGYDDAAVSTFWSQTRFALVLDQSPMELEARWVIGNNLTPDKTVPDFLDYIHEAGLKAIKPDAVNIIR